MYDELNKEELITRLEDKDRKWKEMVVSEHELKEALLQATHQLDQANQMIANLLKQRRENNWLYAPVDNSEDTASAVV